jgi:hypothetical protein
MKRPHFAFGIAPVLFSLAIVEPAGAFPDDSPTADPAAVVTAGQARFTVLTPELIRMEWSADSTWEDHASLVFLNRRMPVPVYHVRDDGAWREIATEKLTLRYRMKSGRFSETNLEVSFMLNGKRRKWHPGMKNTANLGGTIRTLDGVRGPTPLEPGLLSRDGWALVDDSARPLLDGSEWSWVKERPTGDRQDLYFFGHGHEYKKLLADFTQVAGKIPMPPRFAFGTWWSRYWAYTDQEFKELVHEYEVHDVPLDVLVIDMDWHLTFDMRWSKDVKDQAGERLGWTGYTWDKNYFPEPANFLAWCDQKGLRTPLNLHPASGIQPHEEHYPEMAKAMGIDPATKKYVPFDIVDKKFATNYMKLIIRPLERQGVDFWWLDWQQWGTTKIAGVTPTWWLNYVFFTDMERQGASRPLLFHRWGGLGNHRYEIGFSGDVVSVWESLAFQPYFTATASNVGFGYWSHDIGGHMPGPESPELYTRWIQFGVFSPILRTHTTKNPEAERRIWAYPEEYFELMRDAFLLRYALIPYIYTASREAYDTGVSICRPMYYDYPEAPEAYDFKDEYMFGDDMLVAPVATPVSAESLFAVKKIWLPPGDWIEWFTGTRLNGPAVLLRTFAIDEIPVYVKAGAIIPQQPKMRNSHEKPVDPLILVAFPGDTGESEVYEDGGNSVAYKKGEFAQTIVRQTRRSDRSIAIEVMPAQGRYQGMPTERSYEVRLPLSLPPEAVSCGGKPLSFNAGGGGPGWRYDGDHLSTIITVPAHSVVDTVDIVVRESSATDAALMNGVPGKIGRLRRVMKMIDNQWPKEWSPGLLVASVQIGNRMSLHPETARSELDEFSKKYPEILKQIGTLDIDAKLRGQALHHLGE